jgi:hypothetical protein
MFVKLGIALVCYTVFSIHGCDSKSGAGQDSAQVNVSQTPSASPSNPAVLKGEAKAELARSPASSPGLEVCGLIEKSEIASVQGAQVQSAAPSNYASGGLVVSQCYYAVASEDGSKNLSVHLQVIQADPKSSRPKALRDYWERAFRREKGRGEDEEEEETSKAQVIRGFGEEAFWLGNSRGGALYTLKKAKLVRVMIGGADDTKTRIEKSKTLAAKVLKRLS